MVSNMQLFSSFHNSQQTVRLQQGPLSLSHSLSPRRIGVLQSFTVVAGFLLCTSLIFLNVQAKSVGTIDNSALLSSSNGWKSNASNSKSCRSKAGLSQVPLDTDNKNQNNYAFLQAGTTQSNKVPHNEEVVGSDVNTMTNRRNYEELKQGQLFNERKGLSKLRKQSHTNVDVNAVVDKNMQADTVRITENMDEVQESTKSDAIHQNRETDSEVNSSDIEKGETNANDIKNMDETGNQTDDISKDTQENIDNKKTLSYLESLAAAAELDSIPYASFFLLGLSNFGYMNNLKNAINEFFKQYDNRLESSGDYWLLEDVS